MKESAIQVGIAQAGSHRRASMNERSDITEAMMDKDDGGDSLDRRMFLGASTTTLLGLPGIGLAQQQRPSAPGEGGDPAARAPSQAIADFDWLRSQGRT